MKNCKINAKKVALTKYDFYSSFNRQTSSMKKDQHRHSVDGYDLNNVAGK
jgi:hypothetical protein